MIWFLISFIIIVLDQFTKYIVVKNLDIGVSIPVIYNFFNLTYIHNKGAAWGIFQNGRYFFIAITSVISVGICVLILKNKNRVLKLSFSFVLGGALGNLVDRVRTGNVVDFFDFFLGDYHWPVFNIADIFVVVGTIILGYYLLFLSDENNKMEVG